MTDTEKSAFLANATDITLKSSTGNQLAPMTKAENVIGLDIYQAGRVAVNYDSEDSMVFTEVNEYKDLLPNGKVNFYYTEYTACTSYSPFVGIVCGTDSSSRNVFLMVYENGKWYGYTRWPGWEMYCDENNKPHYNTPYFVNSSSWGSFVEFYESSSGYINYNHVTPPYSLYSQVRTNTSDISGLKKSVSTNTSNIATNASDIANLKTGRLSVVYDVEENTTFTVVDEFIDLEPNNEVPIFENIT